jgi:hypothetical protein
MRTAGGRTFIISLSGEALRGQHSMCSALIWAEMWNDRGRA